MSKFNFIYEDPSSGNEVNGSTPHGIYDADSEFQSDSLTVCKYVSRKLGHPVMQLEFNSGSMYACFEEAVSEYSQQINHYNTKNWMWEHYGNTATETGMSSTGSHQAEMPVGGMSLFTLSFVSIALALAKSYDIGLIIYETAGDTLPIPNESNNSILSYAPANGS